MPSPSNRPINGHTTRVLNHANGQGRDGTRRSAAGNPGGPGRPSAAKERDYLECLRTACTLDELASGLPACRQGRAGRRPRARDWLSEARSSSASPARCRT